MYVTVSNYPISVVNTVVAAVSGVPAATAIPTAVAVGSQGNAINGASSIQNYISENWSSYHGYITSELSQIKQTHLPAYNSITGVLGGDSVPSTYDESWVSNAIAGGVFGNGAGAGATGNVVQTEPTANPMTEGGSNDENAASPDGSVDNNSPDATATGDTSANQETNNNTIDDNQGAEGSTTGEDQGTDNGSLATDSQEATLIETSTIESDINDSVGSELGASGDDRSGFDTSDNDGLHSDESDDDSSYNYESNSDSTSSNKGNSEDNNAAFSNNESIPFALSVAAMCLAFTVTAYF